MRRASSSSRCNRMQAEILTQLPTPTQTLLLRYYIFFCHVHDSVREDDPGTSVFVYAIHRVAIVYTTCSLSQSSSSSTDCSTLASVVGINTMRVVTFCSGRAVLSTLPMTWSSTSVAGLSLKNSFSHRYYPCEAEAIH